MNWFEVLRRDCFTNLWDVSSTELLKATKWQVRSCRRDAAWIRERGELLQKHRVRIDGGPCV